MPTTISNEYDPALSLKNNNIPPWPPALETALRSINFCRQSGGETAMSASLNSTPTRLNENEEQGILDFKLLNAVNDRYGGVIVEVTQPMDSDLFASLLRASIVRWRHQGKRGVWIKLPIQHVNLVEAAVEEGCWYHHAEPNYLMLVYWIPQGPQTLPANASHRVSIGAFVMNEKREVLVVQENIGRFRGTGVWKFPTGVVNEGEDLCAAAVREVKEETAVDTKFVQVLAFRQSHKVLFEKSDIFFLCLLEPLSSEIQKQESEIEAAKWMPFEEYAAQPFVQKHELFKCSVDIFLATKDGNYSGFSPLPTSTAFSDEKNYMYFNTCDLNGQQSGSETAMSASLNAVNHMYGGVSVEVTQPMDSALFASLLRALIALWRHQGKRGVWIKLPIQHVNLVEAAVESRTLFRQNASHQVSIGAFVMNEKRQVLVVQENIGRFRGSGVWKFPMGVVNESEDLCAAAVREVKDETARMPFEEYAAQSFVQKQELFKCIVNICLAKKYGNYSGFSPMPTSAPQWLLKFYGTCRIHKTKFFDSEHVTATIE
ncbi:hypothetical protein V6N11_025381 [Hibiscus sabdariffa]|uniref:Nudix hydrolase domain-containing protein n=1 Tax=Hibiscus sabdariffa TaxID=183260 RepID=A0ABR1ZXM6_9ROSI